jgi:hypothetical protein
VIQFLIEKIGTQIFAIDVLAALLKNRKCAICHMASFTDVLSADVRKDVAEDSKDHSIVSLRQMILGKNDNERYGAVQALSIFAQYSK